MSLTNIEKFNSILSNSEELAAQINESVRNGKPLRECASEMAEARGLSFTPAQFDEWAAQQKQSLAADELSDAQLDNVAGGTSTSSGTTSASVSALAATLALQETTQMVINQLPSNHGINAAFAEADEENSRL
ncbi:MAG: hypothetical protein AAGF45_02610 [Pseudomonadota bacterium]